MPHILSYDKNRKPIRTRIYVDPATGRPDKTKDESGKPFKAKRASPKPKPKPKPKPDPKPKA